MKQKFDIVAYRNTLNEEIATLTKKVEEMKKDRYGFFWEIRDLEDKIAALTLRLDPKFVCEYCYSDRHAYEVIRMDSERQLVVRRLNHKRVNVGEHYMSDCQEYEFTPNEEAPMFTIRLRKDGFFYEVGGCTPFGITSEPYEYSDYSF